MSFEKAPAIFEDNDAVLKNTARIQYSKYTDAVR